MMTPTGKVQEELQLNARLWDWFLQVISRDRASEIVVHLSDLHASAESLRNTIAGLLELAPSDKAAVRKQLVSLDTQLYHHLTAHVEELRHPLGDLIKDLYAEDESGEG
jgi:hypothetical protein